MKLKPVFRYDPAWPKLRLFRLLWDGRERTPTGSPVSNKLAVALRPRLFRLDRAHDGWRLVLFGVEVHRQRSWGGRFV